MKNKKINIAEVYKQGQLCKLEIFKPKAGNFPIAKTDEGIVCKIESGTRAFFQIGSTWEFEIVEVRETSLLVKAIGLYLSKSQNEQHASAYAKEIFGKEKKERVRKPKVNYQFKASYEK